VSDKLAISRYLTTGKLNPKLTDVFSDRTLMIATKQAREMNGMSADGSGNAVKGQGLGKMSVKNLPGLLERSRPSATQLNTATRGAF
jgi:hypothetical protein